MVIWNILDESSGASQPAFEICPYGAAQPLEAYVAQCVGIRLLNFNMGMPGVTRRPGGQNDRMKRMKRRESKASDSLRSSGHT